MLLDKVFGVVQGLFCWLFSCEEGSRRACAAPVSEECDSAALSGIIVAQFDTVKDEERPVKLLVHVVVFDVACTAYAILSGAVVCHAIAEGVRYVLATPVAFFHASQTS